MIQTNVNPQTHITHVTVPTVDAYLSPVKQILQFMTTTNVEQQTFLSSALVMTAGATLNPMYP